MKQEEKAPKKRVSFLMPYIDFCFMLIIIFVGMLSIAYFEPLGTTDIESRHTKKVDMREGQFNKKPVGIQQENLGTGDEEPSDMVYPLIPGGGLKADGTPVAMTRKTGKEKGDASVKELKASRKEVEKLKELLDKKEEELKKLKETEVGQGVKVKEDAAKEDSMNQESGNLGKEKKSSGNHYYIDLRVD